MDNPQPNLPRSRLLELTPVWAMRSPSSKIINHKKTIKLFTATWRRPMEKSLSLFPFFVFFSFFLFLIFIHPFTDQLSLISYSPDMYLSPSAYPQGTTTITLEPTDTIGWSRRKREREIWETWTFQRCPSSPPLLLMCSTPSTCKLSTTGPWWVCTLQRELRGRNFSLTKTKKVFFKTWNSLFEWDFPPPP